MSRQGLHNFLRTLLLIQTVQDNHFINYSYIGLERAIASKVISNTAVKAGLDAFNSIIRYFYSADGLCA